MSETDEAIADRKAALEARIDAACRESGRARDEVTLVAISKKQPIERLFAAHRAGQRVFGENYVQELEARVAEMPDDVSWHFVGHLQRNKAKKVAALASLVHTVDSRRLALALDEAAKALGRRLPVLLQVNIDHGSNKAGVLPNEAGRIANELRPLTHLELRGLMAIPEPASGALAFAALRELAEALRASTGLPLPELSMGMSADFEAAIHEGATLVRIGTDFFGRRGPGI